MQVWNSLSEELGDLSGTSSPSSTALCRAIIDDAQMARDFEMAPHGAMELLRAVRFGPSHLPASAPLTRELTSLIF
jgi:hypothetical protein